MSPGTKTCIKCDHRFKCTPRILGPYFYPEDTASSDGGDVPNPPCLRRDLGGDPVYVTKEFRDELIEVGFPGAYNLRFKDD